MFIRNYVIKEILSSKVIYTSCKGPLPTLGLSRHVFPLPLAKSIVTKDSKTEYKKISLNPYQQHRTNTFYTYPHPYPPTYPYNK